MLPLSDRSRQQYDNLAQLLHWLMAILVIVVFGLGWYMTFLDRTDPATFQLYQIHKGIGVVILGLAVLRLLWRLTHAAPPLPDHMKGVERLVASAAHGLLYGLIFLQPVIGILQSNAANFPIVLFGQFELPALIGPNKVIEERLVGLHHLLAKILAVLVLAHIAAALRHHLILKDDVLRRMMPSAAVGLGVIILSAGILGPQFTSSLVTGGQQVERAQPEEGAAPIAPSTAGVEAVTDRAEAETSAAVPSDGAWAVEEDSALGFIARQQGAEVPGSFERFEAEILFDPADLENSRISVEIDVTSISTGYSDRDQMLNSASFFETATWPRAIFRSTAITAAGEGGYEAAAELTMRDVTKAVTLPFTLVIEDDPADPARELAHAQGELPVLRLDYGIGQGDWASTSTVADEVVITIDLRASRSK